MFFIALMFLTTSAIAGAAAFFSVYGLAHTFSASFWSVAFMGASLEAGKLMTASFLYRFRDKVNLTFKIPAYAFVFALMLLTSVGIYGYLSEAYQADTVAMKQVGSSLELKKEEQANLQKRKTEIDTQISQLPTNDSRGRQRLMKQFGPEVQRINDRLTAVTAEIQAETQKQIQTDSHVGPIVYIAKMVGLDADHATSILILLIIFAFDPLAILLTIATNIAIRSYQDGKKKPVNPEMLVGNAVAVTRDDIPWHFESIPPTDTAMEDFVSVFPNPNACSSHVQTPPSIDIGSLEDFQAKIREALHIPPAILEEVPPVDMSYNEEPVTDTEDIQVEDDKLDHEVSEPPVEVPTQPSKMEALGTVFADQESEDVDHEEGTVQPVIKQIETIYQEAASKDESEKTPIDKETVDMVEKFFARQKMIQSVRNGTVE